MNMKENDNNSEGSNKSNPTNSENSNENGKRVRRNKKQMYSVEREKIIEEIMEILGVSEENRTFILYDVENSLELKKKMDEMSDKIKRYFKTGNWNYYIQRNNGEQSPMIGLIRSILRDNGIDLTKKDITIKINEKKIRTTKYFLME